MDTDTHIDLLEQESHAFSRLIPEADRNAPVPSCPDWDVADLVWHLTEVQHSWGAVARHLLQDWEEYERPVRVDDELLDIAFASASHELVDALRSRSPDDVCWSWHPDGHSIAWLARRQHHEALIHRADLELALGLRPLLDGPSAADGIDELIDVFLDGFPDWGRFLPGRVVEIAPDGEASRLVEVGRFQGASPRSGTTYDDPAVRRVPDGDVVARIAGPVVDLDLWMWGRGHLGRLAVTGDRELVGLLRSAIAIDTQ